MPEGLFSQTVNKNLMIAFKDVQKEKCEKLNNLSNTFWQSLML